MDENVYFWPSGQWCYRHELEKYIDEFGTNYDCMTADEYFNVYGEMEYDED